jgi:hypothetical protein
VAKYSAAGLIAVATANNPMPSVLVNIVELQSSWMRALRAERKSPATIEQYSIGLRLFILWCHTHGNVPAIDRTLVRQFIEDLLAGGSAPSTATLESVCAAGRCNSRRLDQAADIGTSRGSCGRGCVGKFVRAQMANACGLSMPRPNLPSARILNWLLGRSERGARGASRRQRSDRKDRGRSAPLRRRLVRSAARGAGVGEFCPST